MTRGPIDPRLLRHARSSRGGVAGLGLAGLGQAAATITVAFALSRLVVGFSAWAVVTLAAAYGARALLSGLTAVVAQRTTARVTDELRGRSLASALRRGPAWIARYGSGRLTAVLTGGLDALGPWFGGYLPSLVLGVALPPLVVAVIFGVDPSSALIAVLTLPLIPVLGALIGWATQARAQQRWDADARLAGHFLDVVQGLPTLRVFGRAERQTGIVAAMTEKHRSATMRVLRVAFLSSTALDLVGTLAVGLIAVSAGLRVADGSLALAPAMLVILLAPEAYRPLREVAARYHAAAAATAVISDVDEILAATAERGLTAELGTTAELALTGKSVSTGNLAPAKDNARKGDLAPTTKAAATVPTPELGGATLAPGYDIFGRPSTGVVASGLRVRHPGSAVDALQLDSFEARGGRLVAVRGPSGAGKTTLLRVLAGLQPTTAGTLAISGDTIYLPQRPMLPHARTVADAFSTDGLMPSTAEVVGALRAVGLDAELTPETPLGERGQGVSAGQRQRLALAVILWKARIAPAVLLLDEPTAHLDPATERLVIAELRAAADRGCTVIAVAHRPALLEAADAIAKVVAPTRTKPTYPDSAKSIEEALPRDDEPIKARRPAVAVALGAASWLAGIVLTGAATWLLVRASTLPPVLTLSAAVVLVRASAIARPLLRYAERLVSHDLAFARLGAQRARVYAALIPRVPGPRLHRRGDLLTRVVTDVDAQVDGLLRGRLPALAAAATVAVGAVVTVAVNPAAAVTLAAGITISAVLAPALAAGLTRRHDATTAQARAQLRDAIVETVDGVEDGTDVTVARSRSRALAAREAKAATTAGLATALSHLGWGVVVIGAALTLGPQPWGAVLLLGLVALGEPVTGLPDAAIARQEATAARRRIERLENEPANGQATIPHSDRVHLEGLTAGWDRAVLRNVDLDIPPGTSLAVVGASGSGKSTLAAVLAGLLDPRDGEIKRPRRTALVSDDADHIFASTVRDNLRLARPHATDDDLVRALDEVGLGDWDLDTVLGTGGTTVSGGQRKRFATARALLTDPDLLVLDEPTEGLDVPAAEALMADLLDVTKGRTVLLLAHRTEGLDRVDRTAEIAGGRLRTLTTANP